MKERQVVNVTTKTILLINSEPNLREVVQVCLSHLGGWQVSSTGSPAEGLQRAIHEQPDAIVVDLSTSGMDYFTFLTRLRTHSATQTIPVVLVTVGAKWLDHHLLEQFQVAGAIDYLPDPLHLSTQIATLLNWDDESPFLQPK